MSTNTNAANLVGSDGMPVTSLYDSGSGALVQPRAGTVSTDSSHSSNKYAALVAQIADAAGTNVAGVDAVHLLLVTDGGANTTQVTASSAAAIKTSAGRLCKVIPTTTVTAAVNVYDNTNAASGTVLCAIPASATIGTVYDVQMKATAGIYVGGGAGTPQLTVSWS